MTGKKQELDHPDQAMDTDLPDGEEVKKDVFAAMRDAYEGDPDEVDRHTDDDKKEKSDG